MDILRFVNSKDIRKHLKKIGYKFNSLEAAWLIYQCKSATIEEKHAAWEELIETMPDVEIPERINTIPQSSLHTFLKQYMELEDAYLKDFYTVSYHYDERNNTPYVYRIRYCYSDGDYCECPAVFSQFDACRKYIMESEDDLTSIQCVKLQINASVEKFQAKFTPYLDMLSIEPHDLNDEAADDIFYGVFDGLWFDFPTPFKTGDIVWDPANHSYGCCGGPFVLTDLCLEGIEDEQRKEYMRKNADSSDMLAQGYFIDNDTGIYYECMSNYIDLEYYDKELAGTSRTLIALSNFLKGKIDAALYARAYQQIMTEEYLQNCIPKGYLKSGLILAGLKKAEHIKLWLDDLKEAPAGYYRCMSVNGAKKKIIACEREGTVIDVIDCDHDLGIHSNDGGDAIALIDWLAERKTYYPIKLHTMNPVGRKNMELAIERYWNEK